MDPVLRIASDDGKRLPKKIAFTVASLNAIKAPEGGRVWVYDARTPRLGFMATGNGARAFYLCRRINGRYKRIRLGGFPDISIEQARNLAAKRSGEIAEGRDPLEERKAARMARTFGNGFTLYIEQHAKPKKRTWREDQQKYDLYLKHWENRPLASITTEEVQALHAKIGNKHKGAANRTLALLSKAFNFLRVEPNPCRGITKFPEHKRARFLQPAEVPKLWEALALQDEIWQDFFVICLLTGARRGNVQSMEWAELDLEAATWKIPPSKFKSGDKTGEPMLIPLVPEAVKILKRRLNAQRQAEAEAIEKKKRKPDEPPCPWVFPSWGSSGHIKEPKKAWEAIQKASGLTDLRIHDLRRSLGSWQAATGANLSVIGKSLGHSNTSTTAIYARLNLDPVRDAVGKATDALLAAAKGKKKRKK